MRKRLKILAVTVALAGVMAVPFAYGGNGHGQYGNQNGYCRYQDCDQQNPQGDQHRYGHGENMPGYGDSNRYDHRHEHRGGSNRGGHGNWRGR